MILTSTSKDVDQAPPVTTTFDVPEDRRVTRLPSRTRRERIDWERAERLHSFVKERGARAPRGARARPRPDRATGRAPAGARDRGHLHPGTSTPGSRGGVRHHLLPGTGDARRPAP